MLAIASYILLATTALAAPRNGIPWDSQYYPGAGSAYPIDYNDDLTIKHPLIKPGSNLVYSFEQIRRDQPPQVEMREESLGKYMYRPKVTTTTTTKPTFRPEPIEVAELSDVSNVYESRYPEARRPAIPHTRNPTTKPTFSPEPIDVAELPHVSNVYESRYPDTRMQVGTHMRKTTTKPTFKPEPIDVAEQPAVSNVYESRYPDTRMQVVTHMRKPTTSPLQINFDDISVDIPDSSRIKPEVRYPPINTWTPRITSTSTPAPKWEDMEHERSRSPQHRPIWNTNYQPEYIPEPTRQWPVDFNRRVQPDYYQSRVNEDVIPTAPPQWSEVAQPEQPPQYSRSISNRGSHKFSWDELMPSSTEAPVAKVAAVTASPQGRPGVVPTLTPWDGDNFGK